MAIEREFLLNMASFQEITVKMMWCYSAGFIVTSTGETIS